MFRFLNCYSWSYEFRFSFIHISFMNISQAITLPFSIGPSFYHFPFSCPSLSVFSFGFSLSPSFSLSSVVHLFFRFIFFSFFFSFCNSWFSSFLLFFFLFLSTHTYFSQYISSIYIFFSFLLSSQYCSCIIPFLFYFFITLARLWHVYNNDKLYLVEHICRNAGLRLIGHVSLEPLLHTLYIYYGLFIEWNNEAFKFFISSHLGHSFFSVFFKFFWWIYTSLSVGYFFFIIYFI